ncbi:MAG: ACT domain-containing protein [Lachnospiraceae bacterium]|nr:ACT domain-containing protein [Lachnospiraceae bacterium]
MKKAIITVVGHDTVGIIAAVCTYLAEQNINILDINQTIVNGYFNMMMITDVSDAKQNFNDMVSGLEDIGKKVGVSIHCQREDIFDSMHRI